MSVPVLIRSGTPAPDGELAASSGRRVRLADAWRDANVLLVFYPGNDTPG